MNAYLVKLQMMLDELNNSKPEQLGDVFDEYRKILSTLDVQGLSPMVKSTGIKQGDYVNTTPFNNLFDQLKLDITALYQELVSLNQILSLGFNQVVTEQAATIKKVKKVRSVLADLKLFTTNFHDPHFYISESLVNTDNIDFNSDFVINGQAAVDQTEGIATLGFPEGNVTIYKIISAAVGYGNGKFGNNWIQGALKNGNPDLIIDNNPDTWFEYEMYTPTGEESDKPLTLGLIAKLDGLSIVNKVMVQPNNFGGNWPKIEKIETSIDGKAYTSVLDNSMLSGFVIENQPQKVFQLGPAGSKFEGILSATFFPRSARFIRIGIIQDTPYPITDFYGKEKLRYAIGIRGMWVMGIQYGEKAEVVSKEISLGENAVNKLALSANEISLVPPLMTTIYEVSPDNGTHWYQILPIDDPHFPNVEDIKTDGNNAYIATQTQPASKVLSFNTGDDKAIITTEPVTKIRWRIRFERNTGAFNATQNLYTKKLGRGYVPIRVSVTVDNPIRPENVLLHWTFFKNNVLFDAGNLLGDTWNSFTCDALKFIKTAIPTYDFQTLLQSLAVYVNGKEWNRATNNRFVDNTTETYRLTKDGYMFGDGTYTSGKKVYDGLTQNQKTGGNQPPLGAKISLVWQNEVIPKLIGRNPLRFKLPYPSDMDKGSTIVSSGIEEIEIEKVDKTATLTVPIPIGIKEKRIDTADVTGTVGRNLPDGWTIRKRTKGPIDSSTDFEIDMGPPPVIGVTASNIIDKSDNYVFIYRQYMNGDAEFKLQDSLGNPVNVHSHPSSFDQLAPSNLNVANYIPVTTEDETFIGTTGTFWIGSWDTKETRLTGVNNGTLMTNLKMLAPWDINSIIDKKVIFYSVAADEGEEAIRVFFSKPISNDCQAVMLAIDAFYLGLSQDLYEYSAKSDDLGMVIEADDKIYKPVTRYFHPETSFTSAIEWIDKGGGVFVAYQIVLNGGGFVERGSITPPKSLLNKGYFNPASEVPYINGNDEFQIVKTSSKGLYSVDYEEGKIHFPPDNPLYRTDIQTSPKDPFSFKAFTISVYYNIGISFLPGSVYGRQYVGSVDVSSSGNQTWTIKPQMKIPTPAGVIANISWDRLQGDPNPISTLAGYFSPIVRDFELTTAAVYSDDLPQFALPEDCLFPTPVIDSVVYSGEGPGGEPILTIEGTSLLSIQSVTYMSHTYDSTSWATGSTDTELVININTGYVETMNWKDKCNIIYTGVPVDSGMGT